MAEILKQNGINLEQSVITIKFREKDQEKFTLGRRISYDRRVKVWNKNN